MKTNIKIIKSWFKTKLKPTQSQFWDWMDSFWHKDEKIPIKQIQGITSIYKSIEEIKQTLNSNNSKIYPVGQLQIFKVEPNTNNSILEIGDFVIGFIEGQFINATYLEGDPQLLKSYGVETEIKQEILIEKTNYTK